MAAIITTNMRVYAANQFLNGFSDTAQNIYLFIGQTLPWLDENSPPTPLDCVRDESGSFRNMMSLKKIASGDVSLVIPRNNWLVNTVYTQYSHDIDLFDPNSGLPPFYVMSNMLNVYKCISNNNGAASTIQPTGTSTSVITLSDGYQWKFMYTLPSISVLKFVTNEWIAVQTLTSDDGSLQWQVQQSAIKGTVDRIDIVSSGSQYTSAPTVVISGDGLGASAIATVNNGNISNIIVTSTGSGYSYANITFTGGGVGANGATANAILSPYNGHGSDPVGELGGFFVLISTDLVYSENSIFTVTNDYRQIGVLQNPLLNDGVTLANGLDYDQSLRLTFTSVSGSTFVIDEVITGSISGATGVVLDWNSSTKVLRLVQVLGNFVPGESVVGASASGLLQTFTGTATSGGVSTITLPNSASSVDSFYNGQTIKILSGSGAGQIRVITNYVGSTRVATVSNPFITAPNSSSVISIANIIIPDLLPYSGEILYIENRRLIFRTNTQSEAIKILSEF